MFCLIPKVFKNELIPDPERALPLEDVPLALPLPAFLMFELLPVVLLELAFDPNEELEAIDEAGAVGAGVLAGMGVYISGSAAISNVLF